ncbi:MAG: hypothetical protein RBR71_06010 [Gudongella sp.]|nr:hypothetical protein [Gudongella sp.]
MEYPSKNDFFIKFKALFSEKERFMDYVLVETSKNFKTATRVSPDKLLGMKLTDIVLEIDEPILALKEFHYHMLPKTRRKFDHYIKEENRQYAVSMFSDEKDYLLMVYTDISNIKNAINHNDEEEEELLKQTV